MSDSSGDEAVLKQLEATPAPTEMKGPTKGKDGRAKPRSKAQIEATKRLVESTRARRANAAEARDKILRAKYAPVERREVKSESESSGSDESSSSDEDPPPPRKPSRRQKKAAQAPRRRGRAEQVVHNSYYYGWGGQPQPASAPPAPTPVKAKPERKMQAEEPPKPKPVKPSVKPQPSLRFV